MAVQVTTATPYAALPFPLRAAQLFMLVVGVIGIAGVTYFTMLEPENGMTAVDGAVAALLFIGSLGYIAAGRRLSLGDSDIWLAAVGFATLRLGLSIVKVFGYDEGEAIGFLIVDIIIVALLMVGRVVRP